MRWLFRVLLVLIVVGVGGGGGAYIWLRGSLPTIDGSISVSGISNPVEIVRDRNGIPHIYARSTIDAAFGLGFVHAQDRLWQMEMNRHIGAGRISEVVGEVALGNDKFLRTLGIYDAAEKTFANLDIETRASLEAYAAGVNQYLTTRSGPLPLEFIILGHEPEPWKPADSLVWVKMMAWDLGGNWADELLRARMLRTLSSAQVAQLFPPYPSDGEISLEEYAELFDRLPLDELWAATDGLRPDRANGSNNWVVSGDRTATGKPLLANDPHLSLGAPALWYFAHMNAPGLNVIGATLPGVPSVVLGRNDHIAWGFTNTGPDVQDLFIERLDPNNSDNYLTPDGSQPFTIRDEVIRVKDGEDVPLRVRITRHGPIISDIVDSFRDGLGDNEMLAFSWTALRPDDLTAQAGRKINTAQNWTEFVAALREFHAPQQNIAYADVDGNIGYYAPARVPIRRNGNVANGLVPAPGWDGSHDWVGFIPFDELPHLYNPAGGAIATANNKVVSDDYPYFLTTDWAPPFRAERINELLKARDKHSIESFRAMQGDIFSPLAVEFLSHLVQSDVRGDRPQAAIKLLHEWDGNMDRRKPEPLIFSAWYRELTRLIYADELGDIFEDYWNTRPIFLRNILNNDPVWCDDITTDAAESCSDLASRALVSAIFFLSDTYGDDIEKWRWGDAHSARSAHAVFSGQPIVGDLFEIDIPSDGGAETLNRAIFKMNDSEHPFRQFHGPSLRAIYDLEHPNRSLFIHSTGQSGNRLSGSFSDFSERWRDIEYVPMTTQREDIDAGAMGTLILEPSGS